MRRRIWLCLICLTTLLVADVAGAGARPSTPPVLADCPVLPADNIWNTRVDQLPLAARSAAYIASIGPTRGIHPDFGAGLYEGHPIGIPLITVPAGQPSVPIVFGPDGYPDESDSGPFPIPANAPIEGGPDSDGDRHVLVVQEGSCRLYELYRAFPQDNGSWQADASAVYDLNLHALRPDTWTSADAAGLPILPGLVRYDEVVAGAINHALRFTIQNTQRAYVWPARHYASSNTNLNVAPMGQRFRLRADFPIGDFAPEVQVILLALKQYGIIVADNGGNWFLSGAPDERWNNDVLVEELARVKGADFEAVDVSSLQIDPDSGQARVAIDFTPTHWFYLPNVDRNAGGTIPPSTTD